MAKEYNLRITGIQVFKEAIIEGKHLKNPVNWKSIQNFWSEMWKSVMDLMSLSDNVARENKLAKTWKIIFHFITELKGIMHVINTEFLNFQITKPEYHMQNHFVSDLSFYYNGGSVYLQFMMNIWTQSRDITHRLVWPVTQIMWPVTDHVIICDQS